MRVYIGYKSRNTPDKKKLKEDLIKISNAIESLGHETFILDRDIKGWEKEHTPVHSNLWPIIKNIFKSDLILAYVINDHPSRGLFFETIVANIFRKKDILAVKKSTKASFYRKNIKKTIEFEDINQLLSKLPEALR